MFRLEVAARLLTECNTTKKNALFLAARKKKNYSNSNDNFYKKTTEKKADETMSATGFRPLVLLHERQKSTSAIFLMRDNMDSVLTKQRSFSHFPTRPLAS